MGFRQGLLFSLQGQFSVNQFYENCLSSRYEICISNNLLITHSKLSKTQSAGFWSLEQVPLKSQEIAFLLVQAGSWEVEVTNFKAFHFQSDTLCCPQRTFTCFLVQFFLFSPPPRVSPVLVFPPPVCFPDGDFSDLRSWRGSNLSKTKTKLSGFRL